MIPNPCKCKDDYTERLYAGKKGISKSKSPMTTGICSLDRIIGNKYQSRVGCRDSIHHQSSVSRSSRLILKIMTSNPMVTIMNKAKPNHPKIMAVVPTPDLTLPLPRSWAIVLAATEAVCCHSTDTNTKTEAMKMRARATCDTGLEGKGLTSLSEPRSSVSSCQPGKVPRMMKQTKARTMATILQRKPN